MSVIELREKDAPSPGGDEVNQPQPQASTTHPSQPQATQPQTKQTVQPQASEPPFQPQSTHPKNLQGIFVHRQTVFEDEESVSTHTLPNLPFLNPDPIEAYQTFEPSQAPTQTPTQATTQAPIQTTNPESPTNTLDTNIPSQTAIQPPPITPVDKALQRYRDDWTQAALKVKKRYPRVPMDEAFLNQAADFLTYVTYRGTEYYKIFNLRKAFSEESIEEKEAALLQFIGVGGFKELLNKPKYLELLDAVVKRTYPNAKLLESKLSEHEEKLVEKHAEELSAKNQEILYLKG